MYHWGRVKRPTADGTLRVRLTSAGSGGCLPQMLGARAPARCRDAALQQNENHGWRNWRTVVEERRVTF